jgi:enoyl-CoA hydratase/carnithine racemase
MSEIIRTVREGVLELRLDRPRKKNALTFEMYGALAAAVREAQTDPAIGALLLSANGDAFCAGNDIGDFLAGVGGEFTEAPPVQFVTSLVENDKPLVAAVGGAAVGVGATMLLHCDIVLASDRAVLSMPFVNLGLVPEAASSALLPARVGPAVASEMLLLGASIDAKRAYELHLVNRIVPASELIESAHAVAVELAAKPPEALRVARSLLHRDRPAVRARADEEAKLFAERLVSAEAREAFTAFLEKRKPVFRRAS